MKTANDMIQEKGNDIVCVPVGTTVMDALSKMNDRKVGAILVTRDDKPTGIWTERDLLRAMDNPDFDPANARVGDHMTSKLHCAGHDTPLIELQEEYARVPRPVSLLTTVLLTGLTASGKASNLSSTASVSFVT